MTTKGQTRRLWTAIPVFAIGLLIAAAARSQSADWAALVAAAQGEKSVTFYSSLVEQVNQAVAGAFEKKYGIHVNVLRLASGGLIQRYSAEAEAKAVACDVIMPSSSGPFLATALSRGWTIPVAKAGLPTVQSGEFPSRWLHPEQGAAVVEVLPWLFAYNEQVMKSLGLQPPRNWPDLLAPKLKGQILVSDPAATDSYIQLWELVLQSFGEDYLHQLKAQDFRIVASGAPNIQSLAAGEGAVAVPTIGSLVSGVASKGAPVRAVLPESTTGNEIALTLSSQAPHPNAARLLVNFLMSREGNPLLSGAPMEFSVYRTDLPNGYRSPDPDAVSKSKARILQLIGTQ